MLVVGILLKLIEDDILLIVMRKIWEKYIGFELILWKFVRKCVIIFIDDFYLIVEE